MKVEKPISPIKCHKCGKKFDRFATDGTVLRGKIWGRYGDPSHGDEHDLALCAFCTVEFYKWCYPDEQPKMHYINQIPDGNNR